MPLSRKDFDEIARAMRLRIDAVGQHPEVVRTIVALSLALGTTNQAYNRALFLEKCGVINPSPF